MINTSTWNVIYLLRKLFNVTCLFKRSTKPLYYIIFNCKFYEITMILATFLKEDILILTFDILRQTIPYTRGTGNITQTYLSLAVSFCLSVSPIYPPWPRISLSHSRWYPPATTRHILDYLDLSTPRSEASGYSGGLNHPRWHVVVDPIPLRDSWLAYLVQTAGLSWRLAFFSCPKSPSCGSLPFAQVGVLGIPEINLIILIIAIFIFSNALQSKKGQSLNLEMLSPSKWPPGGDDLR